MPLVQIVQGMLDNNSVISDNIVDRAITANKLSLDVGAFSLSGINVLASLSATSLSAAQLTFPSGKSQTTPGYTGFRNLIINGDMRIDQRNAGSPILAVNTSFPCDRFSSIVSVGTVLSAQQNQGSVTPPPGFTNYIGYRSVSAHNIIHNHIFSLEQKIEGLTISHLNWGSINAAPITLSFWARSNLSGTFTGGVWNSNAARSYLFSYNIINPNTWEKNIITIPGDTSGTWLTDANVGFRIFWTLGLGQSLTGNPGLWYNTAVYGVSGSTSILGTSGAHFYLTGVQCEQDIQATEFERRPFGTELALCQRYYQTIPIFSGSSAYAIVSNYFHFAASVSTPMRASPVTITPANCGTLLISSAGSAGRRYPVVYPSTGALISSFYTAVLDAEF